MPVIQRITLFSGLLPLLIACNTTSTSHHSLKIAAAVSLRDAFLEMGTLYEKKYGIPVAFSFASSGVLKLQIQQGAAFDLFASASPLELEELKSSKTLTSPIQVLAYNHMVLVANPEHRCQALSKLGSLAIGNPKTVPAGRYAQTILTQRQAGPLLTLHFTEHARQISSYLSQGIVAYGMIYQSDLKAFPRFKVCEKYKEPAIALSMAALNQKAENQGWLDFIQSDQARHILKSNGFELP